MYLHAFYRLQPATSDAAWTCVKFEAPASLWLSMNRTSCRKNIMIYIQLSERKNPQLSKVNHVLNVTNNQRETLTFTQPMTGPVSVALFIIPIDLSTLYIVTFIIKDDLQFPQRVSVARIKNIYTLYKFNFYSEPMFIHYEILL